MNHKKVKQGKVIMIAGVAAFALDLILSVNEVQAYVLFPIGVALIPFGLIHMLNGAGEGNNQKD